MGSPRETIRRRGERRLPRPRLNAASLIIAASSRIRGIKARVREIAVAREDDQEEGRKKRIFLKAAARSDGSVVAESS